MKHPLNPLTGTGIVLAVLAVCVVALIWLNGCEDCPDPVVHTIVITTEGSHCKLSADDGGASVTVNIGEWVKWKNEYGSDVILNFGSSKRLFGVLKAVVYANSELELRVPVGAESGSHEYNVPCATTHPGPVIVVNPPN
jgi:hypothetical protein